MTAPSPSVEVPNDMNYSKTGYIRVTMWCVHVTTCHGYATMRSLSTVDLHVAINNIKPFSVAMETQ